MIHFVDLTDAYTVDESEPIRCFAFIDTVYDIFVDIGHEQIWDDATSFIYAYQKLRNDSDYWNDKPLERFICHIPKEFIDEEAKKYLNGFNGEGSGLCRK